MAAPLSYSDKNKLLEKTSPSLKERLTAILGVDLLSELVSKGGLRNQDKEEILAIPRPGERYQEFYKHLHSTGVKKFIIFCLVLCDKFNREDIVTEVFKQDINNLRMQLAGAPPSTASDISDPAPTGQQTNIGQSLRDKFHQNLVYLCNYLEYSPLKMYLIAKDVFQDEKIQEIDAKLTNIAKIEEVLQSLPRRRDEDYVIFAWAIIETDQTHHLEKIGVSDQDLEVIKNAYKA